MVKPRITSVKINFVPIITDEDKRRRKAGANALYQMLLEDAIRQGKISPNLNKKQDNLSSYTE